MSRLLVVALQGKSCDTSVEACESVPLLCVEDLSDVLAVDFHFDIMSHVVGGVADAVQADVLCLGAFCIDQLALLGRVVVVVVRQGGDAVCERRVVGYLHDDIVAGACLRVAVPHPERCQVGFG